MAEKWQPFTDLTAVNKALAPGKVAADARKQEFNVVSRCVPVDRFA